MVGNVTEFFRIGNKGAQTQPTFTNRVNELALFKAARNAHTAWKSTIDSMNADTPRRNVIDFYGVGGIGKSSLLHRLEKEASQSDSPFGSCYINFEDATAFDIENLILRVRSAVGSLGVKCVAFDFALAFYWGVAHPGETIETYTKNNSALRKLGERVGLSATVENAVIEVAQSIASLSSAAHGATRLASTVAKLATDRHSAHHAIADCEALPLFLDAQTVEQAFSFLPSLLAWDLQQAGTPDFVVFLDTYEEVTRRGHQFERPIQRLCYLLPNVLFVVAGRNQLNWARKELAGGLDYAGPRSWPDLSEPSGRASNCCLIGDLSREDADTYLRDRLRAEGEPAITAAARAKIVEASGGWPLYLEVAAAHYQQLLTDGPVSLDEVGVPFPALITRLMSDLTESERTAVRACALFVNFDEDLLHAGAGSVSNAVVRSVLSRSFVKQSQETPWPYTLHPGLRAALRADNLAVDAWSDIDWQNAAIRIMRRLEERSMTDSVPELTSCVDQGLRLADEFSLSVDWVSEAGRRLAGLGGLGGIRRIKSDTPSGALSRVLFLRWLARPPRRLPASARRPN